VLLMPNELANHLLLYYSCNDVYYWRISYTFYTFSTFKTVPDAERINIYGLKQPSVYYSA